MNQTGNSKLASETIDALETEDFYVECPCCGKPLLLKDAGLFYLDNFTPDAQQLYEQMRDNLKEKANNLNQRRAAISKKSEVGARAVNVGFILERLAPSMKTFRFERNDCRSLFDPIDYVVFEGLSQKGVVSKILFADIKTGKAPLADNQKEIKALVEKKQVNWETYKPEAR
jgi:predicted Holliday junction resolvase-like endonuclease